MSKIVNKERLNKNMIGYMFISSAAVMILTQIIGLVAIIIDGIITSRMLGTDAYSAISLIQPFVTVVLMFAGFLSVGNQVICSRLVGEGKKKEANNIFSVALFMALVLSLLLLGFCIFFPDLLLRICGVYLEKHPDFYNHMIDYLRGYMIGIPAIIFIQIMGPVIVLDNNKKLFSFSALVLCAVDIIGDILNVTLFNGGTFGMGMATTIAYFAQGAFLLSHFFNKNAYFHLSIQIPSIQSIKEIVETGFPAFVTRLATALRNLFISRFNLAVALSAAGVAAKGIQGDVNSFMFCFSLGLGRAMMSMSSLYYGAKDKASIKRLFNYAAKSTAAISLLVGAIVFLAAPIIASIYSSDPDVRSFSIFGMRCMTIGIVSDALTTAYMDYLQGTGKRKLVNVLVFFERFFVPICSAYILGSRFGTEGVLVSVALSKLIMILVILVIISIYRKGMPKGLYDYLLLPPDFGGGEEDNLYAHIETMEDVMRESLAAEDFCAKHGASDRVSKAMALALEELAGNVISHGRKGRQGDFGIDYRIAIDEEEITLTVRDLCEYFDPTAWYEAYHGETQGETETQIDVEAQREAGVDSAEGSVEARGEAGVDPAKVNEGEENLGGVEEIEKGLGLKIVMGLAKETRYFNALNSNNIVFKLDKEAAHETE